MTNETLIIGLLAGIVQAAFWLWVKTAINKMDLNDKSLAEHKLYVANYYVKQTALDQHMDRIDKSLDEIKLMIERISK